MRPSETHQFALYTALLNTTQSIDVGRSIEFIDANLWHRITKVLRLKQGESLILFNGIHATTVELSDKTFSGKNKIIGTVQESIACAPLKPSITLMPSLLKREAFETVIYFAAQMGATAVQPMITAKTHRLWAGEKEQVRLTSIMIAACEQAKNFVIPELRQPIPLTSIPCQKNESIGIYFEDVGQQFASIAQNLTQAKPNELTLIFGPEGGLTSHEQQHLNACKFECCALTPTILRAQEAVAVGLGSIRSLFNKALHT